MALALFNLLFIALALLSHRSPGQLAEALLTWTPLPAGPFQLFLLILASNVGTTVTPWMLFFQQSASVDKPDAERHPTRAARHRHRNGARHAVGMAVFAGIIVLIPGMPLLTITLNANLPRDRPDAGGNVVGDVCDDPSL